MTRPRQGRVARVVSQLVAATVGVGYLLPALAVDARNHSTSKLPQVLIESTRIKEESRYRVGGDVQVISQEEIELRHYSRRRRGAACASLRRA